MICDIFMAYCLTKYHPTIITKSGDKIIKGDILFFLLSSTVMSVDCFKQLDVVVVYYVTILAIGQGLLKKFWLS